MSLSRQSSTRSVGGANRGGFAQPASSSVRGGNANAIRVVARFRPADEASCVEEMGPHHVKIAGVAQPFVLDDVLGPEVRQREVFERCVRATVDGVLAGYNGCVLAYGQTGSGKSHTMMGTPGRSPGVIPRIVDHIFHEKSPEVHVSVGYLEIYNEKIRDLLADPAVPTPPTVNSSDLKLHELAGGGGFYVKGLRKVPVAAPADVFVVMSQGNRNRSTAATLMNQASSRGHTLFLIDVTTPATRAKLVLVDLAGSEKVAKTGARGTLLEEASNINRSLTSLGMVVNALAANQALKSQGSASTNDSGGSNSITGTATMNGTMNGTNTMNGTTANGTNATNGTTTSGVNGTNGSNAASSINGTNPIPTTTTPSTNGTNTPNSTTNGTTTNGTTTNGITANSTTTNSSHSDPCLNHVPFRDSKLTRLLQDSLAGNSRTCLIVHCSPALTHANETVSTLRFGLRAKSVQTQVLVNYVPATAASSGAEQLSAQQMLHTQLLLENRRLHAQYQRSVARRNALREHSERLARELDSTRRLNRADESYLTEQLRQLGPRIAALCRGRF